MPLVDAKTCAAHYVAQLSLPQYLGSLQDILIHYILFPVDDKVEYLKDLVD